MKVILEILFLIFSNRKVLFVDRELIWTSYITAKALLTTKRMELINKKEFVKTELDKDSETFLIYVAALEALLRLAKIAIHPL